MSRDKGEKESGCMSIVPMAVLFGGILWLLYNKTELIVSVVGLIIVAVILRVLYIQKMDKKG